ncbi:uncharacterized protein LOC110716880 [Chenopodium quinoa]|uniref:uncharacterized protein LOC110716880 n=1 Tax=Chenopodium quinoa TaxID=63459 RepID=UPI000B7732F5|nr:uncharacterized protein LOC110716880 [Chenopodium quinoa]
METKIDAKKQEGARRKCGYVKGFGVSSMGLSGGMGLWWRDIRVKVVSYSANHIAVDVLDENDVVKWRVVGVYGWPESVNKNKTWFLMKSLRHECPDRVIYFGDFNEILSDDEKLGGVQRNEGCMDGFREAIDSIGVRDLLYKGNKFTWQRGLSIKTLIQERLDRFLASNSWCNLFPAHEVIHLPIRPQRSDHAPILLKAGLREENRRKKRLFRFEAMWLSNPECEKVLKEAWENAITGNCRKKSITSIYLKSRIGMLELGIMSSVMGIKIPPISITKQVLEGQKNTIVGIEDQRGSWVKDEQGIQKVVTDYFSHLFTSEGVANCQEALEGVRVAVTAGMNDELCKEPTFEEIKTTLFEMHPNKSPGVDGMHALFYQKFWHIVKNDIVSFVINWWHGFVDISKVSKTCIVLIPKCHDLKKITEYRPISLCNVLYKIVSKFLANRLKPLLQQLISPQQSAFVPGRQITDNALIAFEVFHAMKRKREERHGTIALKLDMMKAYDRVEWGFIEQTMIKLGFDISFIQRILNCLSCYSFKFKMNGELVGDVKPQRGLRQGDPISPYLFLLVADAFSCLLSKAVFDNVIHGVKICNGAPCISHLYFADDSILFARSTDVECKEIAHILNVYESALGQKINLQKSEAIFGRNVPEPQKQAICNLLGVKQVNRHEKYLGILTVIGKSKKAIFANLKDRIWKKLQGWKEKLLSRAGKEILIKAVAQEIPTYLMGIFKIPDSLLEEIHGILARFLWGNGTQKKIHRKRWEDLCLPKAKGGMGFRDLKVFNQALLAKQCWRLLHGKNTLVYKVLKARYFKTTEFLDSYRGFCPSYTWRGIWGAKALLKEGLLWRVGDGSSIRAWRGSWVPCNGMTVTIDPPRNGLHDGDLRVAALIDEERRCWQEEELALHFRQEDIKKILSIPLLQDAGQDMIFWSLTTNRAYSVKLGYWVGMLGRATTSSVIREDLWRCIWKMNGPPKLRHFLWRACNNTLVVGGELQRRHISTSRICQRCNDEEESLQYALFFCNSVSEIWEQCSFWRDAQHRVGGNFVETFTNMRDLLPSQELCVFSTLAWAAWTSRNKSVFEETTHNPQQLAVQLVNYVHSYQQYPKRVSSVKQKQSSRSRNSWKKLREGVTKINVDAAILHNGEVGVGVVARDYRGEILFTGARRYKGRWEVKIVEATGMQYGIELAIRLVYEKIWLESDALGIVQQWPIYFLGHVYLALRNMY